MHDRKEIGIFNKFLRSTSEEMGIIIGQNGLRGKKKRRKLEDNLVFKAAANDLLVIKTPGGGGWGQATGCDGPPLTKN